MRRLSGFGLLFLLAGCASTTTVLLPDEDGKVGALVLKHGESELVVDQAYTAARDWVLVDSLSLSASSKERVERQYGETLKAQPTPAASFIVYFNEGGVELTEESSAQFSVIAQTCNARSPAKVYVIGHTDRAGEADANMQLGLERAKQVEQLLRNASALFDKIEVRSFGEGDPLVPTADGVSEAKNRRVEVLIL